MRIWNRFNDMLAILSGACLGLAMVAICIDVCARQFFNSPIVGIVDLVTLLIPIFVFLPLAATEINNSHIRVELFSSHLSKRWGGFFEFLACICGILFLGFMTWVCWWFFWDAWQSGQYLPGIRRLPVWPSKFAMALGAALFAIQVVINLIRTIAKVRSNLNEAES